MTLELVSTDQLDAVLKGVISLETAKAVAKDISFLSNDVRNRVTHLISSRNDMNPYQEATLSSLKFSSKMNYETQTWSIDQASFCDLLTDISSSIINRVPIGAGYANEEGSSKEAPKSIVPGLAKAKSEIGSWAESSLSENDELEEKEPSRKVLKPKTARIRAVAGVSSVTQDAKASAQRKAKAQKCALALELAAKINILAGEYPIGLFDEAIKVLCGQRNMRCVPNAIALGTISQPTVERAAEKTTNKAASASVKGKQRATIVIRSKPTALAGSYRRSPNYLALEEERSIIIETLKKGTKDPKVVESCKNKIKTIEGKMKALKLSLRENIKNSNPPAKAEGDLDPGHHEE